MGSPRGLEPNGQIQIQANEGIHLTWCRCFPPKFGLPAGLSFEKGTSKWVVSGVAQEEDLKRGRLSCGVDFKWCQPFQFVPGQNTLKGPRKSFEEAALGFLQKSGDLQSWRCPLRFGFRKPQNRGFHGKEATGPWQQNQPHPPGSPRKSKSSHSPRRSGANVGDGPNHSGLGTRDSTRVKRGRVWAPLRGKAQLHSKWGTQRIQGDRLETNGTPLRFGWVSS